LFTKENKQPINKPKIFSRKIRNNFWVSQKSVKTYFQYERKKFTVNADKIDWVGDCLERKPLFWQESHQEHYTMSYGQDTLMQYEVALCECLLSAEGDKPDLERYWP
jgi:hypothetical protein